MYLYPLFCLDKAFISTKSAPKISFAFLTNTYLLGKVFRIGRCNSLARGLVHLIPSPTFSRLFKVSQKLILLTKDFKTYKHKCPHIGVLTF